MSHSISGMHWYPNTRIKNDLHQYIPENCPPPPPLGSTDLIIPPPFMSELRGTFTLLQQNIGTHLQQPMDWNINTTHTDTTMSIVPTHATLLHYTSRSHQILGNHPAIKLLLVQLWIMVVSIMLLRLTPQCQQLMKLFRHG